MTRGTWLGAIVASCVACGSAASRPVAPAPTCHCTSSKSEPPAPVAAGLPNECRPPRLNPELANEKLLVAVVRGKAGPFKLPPGLTTKIIPQLPKTYVYKLEAESRVRFGHSSSVRFHDEDRRITFCVSNGTPSAIVQSKEETRVEPLDGWLTPSLPQVFTGSSEVEAMAVVIE